MNNIYDVVIVGAGPAGIMAAITAAKSGKKVVLLEKNEIIGRKILATGNGRCNLTNRSTSIDHYHGLNKLFVQSALEQFDQFETMSFFESQGVALKEEDRARIFPRSNQASTIVEALKHLLDENEVTVRTNVTVKSINKNGDFTIKTEGGDFIAKNVILATGGKASFQFGSSGDGIFWARNLGHEIVPLYAALVPIETEEEWVKDIQGVKVEAKITTITNDKILKETSGDVLFTHFGLSGPAVMAHGGEISPLIESQKVEILIDLYPETSEKELDTKIEAIFKNNSKKSVKNALLGLFPASVVPIILKSSGVNQDKKTSETSKKDRLKIVKTIKGLRLTVKKVRPLKEAQVSRGGVSTDEINENTLESKIVKGLYFAGEIIDIYGDSGGFNLQWAWSSGYVAGLLK